MYNSSHKINIEEKEQKKCKKESGGCGQEKTMLLMNFLPWHSKETTLANRLQIYGFFTLSSNGYAKKARISGFHELHSLLITWDGLGSFVINQELFSFTHITTVPQLSALVRNHV